MPVKNSFLRRLIQFPIRLFYAGKVFFLYHFKLRPRILQMKSFVGRIIKIKQEYFPFGKSLFVFSGQEDTIYFIVFKEGADISVTEVYDEVLNRIPDRYGILPKISYQELLLGSIQP
jgi:hypothetical protein